MGTHVFILDLGRQNFPSSIQQQHRC